MVKYKNKVIKKNFFLKWFGTVFVIIGILLTNLNIFPLNIFLHSVGVLFWTVYGFSIKDKAILTNFGFQIPIFVFGIINYFF